MLIFLARSAGMTGAIHEVGKDRTVRAVIALTIFHQVLEGIAQVAQFVDTTVQRLDVPACQLLYIGAGALAVLPQCQQPGDFLQ